MRKTVLVLVGCLALMAAPAWAGGAFSLFGTYGQVNDYNDSYGAGVRLTLGGESFVVDLTGTWYPKINGIVVDDPGVTIFDSVQMIPFDLGIRYLFAKGSELRPYIGAGGSYALINVSGANVDDEFGYYGLAGLHYGTGGGGLFIEVQYRWLDSEIYGGGYKFEESVGGLAGTVGFSFTF